MSIKNKLLEILEYNRGVSLSGEHLAGVLEVSRNTIWKAVGALKKDGYNISAVTNKGYCLSIDNDILSVQGIKTFLHFPKQADNIKLYNVLESTNKTAKEMAIKNAEHGTIIISDSQTAGKGRYNRQFFSPPQCGLYISFILKPEHLPFENTAIVTSFAALAVCKAIESTTKKEPKIKWINDIFLEDKKICGILTEAVTDFESGNLQWIVLGIGINVSTPDEYFQNNLQSATSIYPSGDAKVTRNCIAAEIINNILNIDGTQNQKEIFDQYKKRLFMLNKKVTVTSGKDSYPATALDIDDCGHLIVENEQGDTISLASGEISIKLQPHSNC